MVLNHPLSRWWRQRLADILIFIFVKEISFNFIRISQIFFPGCSIEGKSTLVQVMAWRRTGDKPLSEPMMTWVKDFNVLWWWVSPHTFWKVAILSTPFVHHFIKTFMNTTKGARLTLMICCSRCVTMGDPLTPVFRLHADKTPWKLLRRYLNKYQ